MGFYVFEKVLNSQFNPPSCLKSPIKTNNWYQSKVLERYSSLIKNLLKWLQINSLLLRVPLFIGHLCLVA